MDNLGKASLTADLGGGRQADVEFSEAGTIWVAVGPGFEAADVWLNADAPLVRLRVRLRRSVGGVEVSVDRGDDERRWWPEEALPRLAVRIDNAAGTATAVASAGSGQDFQEVTLGRTKI